MSRPAAVALLSGGIDSATAAAWARAEGFVVHALSFRYGQRHIAEVDCAARLVPALGLDGHTVLDVPLGVLGGSALTDAAVAVPRQEPDPTRIPTTYVPARNLVFLALAAAVAEVRGATDLIIGANAVDYSGYPDCRPGFFAPLAQALDAGTRQGAEGGRWRIHTPLIAMTKGQIIRLGRSLGVPLELTLSCYDPTPGGRACGGCEACRIRNAGFAAAEA